MVRVSRRIVPLAAVLVLAAGLLPQAAGGGLPSIQRDDLRQWLTYVASDEMHGRPLYGAGLGLTAAYIQEHLREWRIKPGGDAGSYLQTVRVLGVRATSRSTVTVQVGRQSRTFKDGDGVTLPRFQGSKRSLAAARVEFVGYGVDVPSAGQMDYRGKDVRDAAVVYLGANGPRGVDASVYHQILTGRSRYAVEQQHAVATVDASSGTQEGGGRSGRGGAQGAGRSAPAVDFTTARKLDQPIAPDVSASDEFLTFLFSRAPVGYPELKRLAAAREPLPSFRLNDVSLRFDVDVDYEIVRTQLSHNVVGIVEGTDARLKPSHVAIGAHYDHIGYADRPAEGSERPPGAPGRVGAGGAGDHVWNGADDNGSGTVALMAIARAFAAGPPPKRSLLFVWHTGEEAGLYGSRYFADYPTVPLDGIVAQLNLDMIGRNRNDDPGQSNTVYLVGSDRISSELHEISRAANRSLPQPLALDYEMNDPSDPEQLYYRSDHYSYAAKGIPVIFFTTGLHADYHANTDEVAKIDFDKLTRIAGLIYETAARLADLDRAPARDFRGARAGRGTP